MTILAIILFGSRARGDAKPESDTDVLGWTDDAFPSHVQHGSMSLALYPGSLLISLAASGDLFAAHLALEAVALHDPGALLPSLRAAYVPLSSYEPMISAASDFGWFLLDHHQALSPFVINARAAWCARTIAIARTAEAGRLAFAPAALADAVDHEVLPQLIARRDVVACSSTTLALLKRFLNQQGREHPFDHEPTSMRRYHALFELSRNSFALKTMRSSSLKDDEGSYF